MRPTARRVSRERDARDPYGHKYNGYDIVVIYDIGYIAVDYST